MMSKLINRIKAVLVDKKRTNKWLVQPSLEIYAICLQSKNIMLN